MIVHRHHFLDDLPRKASDIMTVAMMAMFTPTGQRRIATAARLGFRAKDS